MDKKAAPGIPGITSTPQAPAFLGARPLAAVLEELAAVLSTLPPERLGDAVGAVVGVIVGATMRPIGDALAAAQRLQDARRDGLVTTVDAARRLRVHPWTIRQAIRSGELPHVRFGRCLRIKTADLEAFVAARRDGGWRRSSP
jgi:excisionase family DNA binding protein